MRIIALIRLAALALLVSCDSAKMPGDANFTTAIDQYLIKHGEVCVVIGREFPIDVPIAASHDPSGLSSEMIVLQQAGLVSESNATAVIHGMLDTLRGSPLPQPVRRYNLTVDGRNSFRQVPSAMGSIGAFCYGQKTVDRIVNWSQAQEGSSQAEVTYTYKLQKLADWAERTDVKQVFPAIRATIDGASKTQQTVGVQLTNTGWQVPGS